MTDQPTPHPDVPMELLMIAQAAFSGRKPMADGTFVLPSDRNPWTALHDALAAVLPAHERQVRERVAAEIEAHVEPSAIETPLRASSPDRAMLRAVRIARGES